MPDRPEKRGAIPRDLHRLKKWADNSPVHEYLLGDIQLEGSSAEKDLVVLVGPKMKMTQRSPCCKEGYWYLGQHSAQKDGLLSLEKRRLREESY